MQEGKIIDDIGVYDAQSFDEDQPDPVFPSRHLPETSSFQLGIELDRSSRIFALRSGVCPVGLIKIRGLALLTWIDLAAIVYELAKPIVVLFVVVDGFLHHFRVFDLELRIIDFLRAFDDPGKNIFPAFFEEDVAIVLDVGVVLCEFVVERNDDDPPPDAIVHTFDLGEVIGVKNQGMGRGEIERCLVFLFAPDIVGGAELLDLAVVKSRPFLGFACDDQPLSPEFGKFRLHVPFAVRRQGVGADLAVVASQGLGDCVPERRFAVPSVTI